MWCFLGFVNYDLNHECLIPCYYIKLGYDLKSLFDHGFAINILGPDKQISEVDIEYEQNIVSQVFVFMCLQTYWYISLW